MQHPEPSIQPAQTDLSVSLSQETDAFFWATTIAMEHSPFKRNLLCEPAGPKAS